MNPPIPDILTVDELSEYLRIPKSTLYKLAQKSKLPGQKIGRHWRFRREAIDTWLGQSIPNQTNSDLELEK